MMKQFIFAGFGGQGMLLIGKFVAMACMLDGKHVSWLPSYGPEMRGGTASCSVIIGDEPVGSPIVEHPDVLMVMNLPSLNRYEQAVQPGGTIFVDSTLVERKVERSDVKAIYIPATRLAVENNMTTLANMILTGKILEEMGEFDADGVQAALKKVVSTKHPEMFDLNLKALQIGRDFK